MRTINKVKEFYEMDEDAQKTLYVISGLCELADKGVIQPIPFKLKVSDEVQDILNKIELPFEDMNFILNQIVSDGLIPWAQSFDDLVNTVAFSGSYNA